MSYTTIVLEEICRVCNNYYDKDETTWCDDGLICKGCFEGKLVEIDCIMIDKRLCNNKYCKGCYYKSFLSLEKNKFWSKKNEKNPRQCFKSSHKKYFFDCNCGHIFESLLLNINKGKWCGFCCNPPKQLCTLKGSTEERIKQVKQYLKN